MATRKTDSELAAMTAPDAFAEGFDYVLRDFADGITVEASFDLATTPGNRRPRAFLDGANAAMHAVLGWLDCARRFAKAHGVTERATDELVERARAA